SPFARFRRPGSARMPVSGRRQRRRSRGDLQMLLVARSAVRSLVFAVLVVLSAAVLGLTATVQSALMLAATTALIVPGTGTPDPYHTTNYLDHAVTYYIEPTGSCVGGCT